MTGIDREDHEMKRFALLLIAMMAFAYAACGFAQEDLRERFACSFLGDKDMDDLMSARDFYLKQSKKAGLETPRAYLWTPLKDHFEFDFFWFNDHSDLNAFARTTDAFHASPQMREAMARFESVADCRSDLSSRLRIYDGGTPPVTSPPAFVAYHSCELRPDVRMTELADLWAHVNDVLGRLGMHKAFHLYVITPLTASPIDADIFVAEINDSATVWARRVGALQSSEPGQALQRHYDALLDCDTSLWHADRVVNSPIANR